MKRRFTILTAALALLVSLAIPMGMRGQTRTEINWSASEQGYSNQQAIESVTFDSNVSAAFNKGTNSNSPKYYTSGTAIRCYGGNYFVISTASGNLTRIAITFGSSDGSNAITTDVGTYTSGTWTGSANSVKFTIGGTSGNRRIAGFTIEYSTGGNPTCATPTFSPEAGDYYTAQNVELSCTTQGATVHYSTTSNEGPWMDYSQAIPVSTTTTIWAYATATDYNPSSVVSATYNILPATFNQDWEGNTNGWTFVSVTGEQVWSVASYQGNHYAKMSGYSGSNYANEDWCISPAFNLGDYTNPVLTFTTARSQHNGNELEVYFSNNYNGDPTAATWTRLTCTLPDQPSSGYSEFTSSGNISLSSYSGSNCYIGFKYTSTTSAAATWELDDIVLANQPITPTITLTPSSIDLGNNNATDVQISKIFTVSQSNLTEGVVLAASKGTLSANTIAQGAEDTEITWTYTPTEAGSINATIIATSAGAETQTLTITGTAVAPITGDRYEKVTEALEDWSGCYIITGTYSDNYYALTGVTSNLGTTAAVTVVGNCIESNSTTDGYQVIVAPTTNGYSLYMDGVGYLGYDSDATSGNNNLHALESFAANTCEWTIAMTDGLATITNVRNNSRTLQFNYNSGNSRFACYTSNQVKPTLFKYTGTVVLPPVISVTNNTVSLEYDATEGSIAYTIDNPVAGTNLTATSEAEWINDITVANDKVNFTTTVNEGNSNRTATITLSYNGASDKVVTVTQGHYVAPVTGDKYVKVTSTADLTSGQYLIVYEGGSLAFDGSLETLDAVGNTIEVTISNNEIAVNTTTAASEFTIDVTAGTIKSASGYYIGAEDFSNQLKTSQEIAYVNSISLDNEGNALLQMTFTGGTVTLKYNSASNQNRFRYYKSGQQAIQLYKKVGEPVTEPLHIIGYTNNGGYYLIASPIGTVAPTQVTNMITDDDDNNNRTYDLYRFDQNPSDGLEWRNYRQGAFNLNIGQGYLYAHRTDVDLVFTGSAISGSTYQVPLTKSASVSGHEFPDWNLVGNPFADVAHIDGGHPFYTLDVSGAYTLVSEGSQNIEKMQGVFVVAGENEKYITFVKGESSKKSPKVTLNVSKGTEAGVIDRAIVCFGETRQMPKFQLFKNSTKVYIPMEGKDYALVRGEEMGAMPVNFKAEENGIYSMNFSCENVGFAYLHLIDNKTGNDVDLLKTPSYSFEAKTTDYESRFKLVFATGDNSNDDTFAFYSNGSFVINNEGNAELQVIDIMGRIVKSESVNGCANVNVNAAPGVYMLRLVNGDNVKVQKVVVK